MPKKITNKQIKRDIDLLYEIGSLRYIPRGWIQHLRIDTANDLEHTIRVIFLSLILARYENVNNEETIIKMALLHDLPETRTADHSYVQKIYVKLFNKEATHDILYKTSLNDFEKLIIEFEKQNTIEARIVKDADNLDIEFELQEITETGNALPKKWSKTRRWVRDNKLYTKSAKKMWDIIIKSDPSKWHIENNKWTKQNNGKI